MFLNKINFTDNIFLYTTKKLREIYVERNYNIFNTLPVRESTSEILTFDLNANVRFKIDTDLESIRFIAIHKANNECESIASSRSRANDSRIWFLQMAICVA